MQKGPKHCRQLASAYIHCLICCRAIVWIMCQMKIYKASHLCRTNHHIFNRVRNNSNHDVNHATAYSFRLHSNVRRQNHFLIHASIRPYLRDNINRVFFHRFGFDIGRFSTWDSNDVRQSILIFSFIFFPAKQIRITLHDFKFDGMAVLSFINYESRNWSMAIDHTVLIVCHSINGVGIPILDHVSTILSCAHNICIGHNGHHNVRHIVGAAHVHIGRSIQSTRPF